MASVDIGRQESYRDRRRGEGREYMALLCLTYPLFLFVAAAGRVFGTAGGQPAEGKRGSIFSEARRTAASIIPFALR